MAELLGGLQEAGAQEQFTALADRAAAHVPLDDPDARGPPAEPAAEAGAPELVAALLRRNPGAHASVENPGDVARLLGWLRQAGTEGQVTALAGRAAAHVSLDDPGGVASLLGSLQQAGSPSWSPRCCAVTPARPRLPRPPGRRGRAC